MRMLPAALAMVLVATAPAQARAAAVDLRCELSGPVPDTNEYKTLIDANWHVDLDKIPDKPREANGGCVPFSRRSEVFGEAKGTRLQFSASKCGDSKPYFLVELDFNGVPVQQHLHAGTSRLVFGHEWEAENNVQFEGGRMPASSAVHVPEGSFRFLYLDCSMQ